MSQYKVSDDSNEKLKNRLIWEHGINNLFPKQFTTQTEYNRYYHRGSSPSGTVDTPNCCKTYLEFNRKYGNNVVSGNNPYADDNPGFAQYLTYSIFKEPVLTNDAIQIILNNYNKNIILDSERLYGPFNQLNLNIISNTAYNEQTWNQGWKGYTANIKSFPVLYQVAYHISIAFKNMINNITNTIPFHLSKHKVMQLLRSTQTHYIKYILNVALTQNVRAKMYTFEVVSYYNPDENKIILGQATLIGSGTTDTILLPKGLDPSLYSLNNDSGRPLYPTESKSSELLPESEIYNLFWKKVYDAKKNSQYIQYVNNQNNNDEVVYGSTASIFPDKTLNQTSCMNYF
jgi:hypothetical protein